MEKDILEVIGGIDQNTVAILSLLTAVFSFLVAFFALVYTVRSYWLKSRTKITGTCKIRHDVRSSAAYIPYLVLHNLKDKAETIFGVYLVVDHGTYVLLEDFEDEPIMIPPFSSIVRNYGLVDRYVLNNGLSVNANLFFRFQNYPYLKIAVSTNSGKYVFKPKIEHWKPSNDQYFNPKVRIIRPKRITFDDESYGDDLLYLVLSDDGSKEPIYRYELNSGRYEGLSLNSSELASAESFESYLRKEERNNGKNIKVLSADQLRSKIFFETREKYDLSYTGPKEIFIFYSVVALIKRLWVKLRIK